MMGGVGGGGGGGGWGGGVGGGVGRLVKFLLHVSHNEINDVFCNPYAIPTLGLVVEVCPGTPV